MLKNWGKANKWEEEWWGNCVNTLGEETKQLLYAQKMGLITAPTFKTPYRFDLQGKSVLDIGGGPVSILLKCENVNGMVIDPLKFPEWVLSRYKEAGIKFSCMKGEEAEPEKPFHEVDEVWIYNVLPHCENPKKIIENAKELGKLIRIFEWIDTPTNIGHIHTLTEENLNKWLKGEGKVEQIKSQNTCFGKAYYGIFPTKRN